MKYYVLEIRTKNRERRGFPPYYIRYWTGRNMFTRDREKAKRFREDREFCETLAKTFNKRHNKYKKPYFDPAWCIVRCTDEFVVEDVIK